MKQLSMFAIAIVIPTLIQSCQKTLIISPTPLRQQIRGVNSLEKLVSDKVINSEKSLIEKEEEYNIEHFISWPTSEYLKTDSDQSPSPTQSIDSDSDSPLSRTPSPKQQVVDRTQYLAQKPSTPENLELKKTTDSLASLDQKPSRSLIIDIAIFFSSILKQCFGTDSSYNQYSAHTVN